jgi:hypothetical protein
MDVDRILKLCTTDNMSLAELYEDPLFGKIPSGMIGQYLAALRYIAQTKAARLKEKNMMLPDICAACGVAINIVSHYDSAVAVPYRAEIFFKESRINIMRQSLVQMYDQIRELTADGGNFPLAINTIIDMHIAHELYHLLEHIEGETTASLLPAVTSWKLGGFRKQSQIVRASEAAAHIFCMELLELHFHPKFLDYLYLLSTGKVDEEGLVKFLQTMQGMASAG